MAQAQRMTGAQRLLKAIPIIGRYLRPRAAAAPERSLALRRLFFLAGLPPLLAVAWSGALWGPALIALAGLAGGHYYSWRTAQLERPPGRVRLALFVGLHLALIYMLAGIFAGIALPQAQFALFAQAITSFDLRRRLNLYSSLGMSLLVLYVAATLSRDYALLAGLLAFAGLALAIFFQVEQEDRPRGARLLASPAQDAAAWSLPLFAAAFSLFAVPAAIFVFAVTPQFAGRPLIPPFSLTLPIRGNPTAQIINPAVPLVQISGLSTERSEYYTGFESRLDLTYRGGLSDAVVMYVRSPAWSYWRSHSYDFYDGLAWSLADTRLAPVGPQARVIFNLPGDDTPGEPIVQTFQIVRDQPNLIFAAYRPKTVYIRADSMRQDSGGGLRVGAPLTAGTLYTVVSHRPDFSAEQLRAAPRDYPDSIRAQYLQLPDSISPRVRALARQLTAGAATPYDQVNALRDHLLTIEYDFFPPPHPPGAEAVDNFLFVDRRGVCEQYVTAHVVMLRSLGIPARLAAGYGAGEFNPLSGYYTVRASDAHAWTEVYYPGYGWVPSDPTPGWTPTPYTAPVQQWIFSNAWGDSLPALPLGDMAAAGAALIGVAIGPLGLAALIGGALVLIVVAARWLRRRWQRRRADRARLIDLDENRRRILAAYRAAQRRLKRYRAPWETPREFARRLDRPEWDELTAAVEQAAYRVPAPPADLAERMVNLVKRMK